MSLRFQRYPSSLLSALTALAFAASLAACGGGGGGAGTTPPLVERPDPPATHLPGLPLQSAWDSANSPVLYVGRNIHVGADVAPDPDSLNPAHVANGITISRGTVADGVGADHLIGYLVDDAHHDLFIDDPDRHVLALSNLPAVVLGQGTSRRMTDLTVRALQIINPSLPPAWRLRLSPTPGPPGTEQHHDHNDGRILIQFAPIAEWPHDPSHSDNPVGQARNTLTYTYDRDSGTYTDVSVAGAAILIDHVRHQNTQQLLDTIVHEIIHALGRDHPSRPLEYDTVMDYRTPPIQHTLYPLDREALQAVYSRLRHGSTVASLAQDLGPWSDTSTHLLGEFSASGQDVAFGVALRNGLAQPWASGPAPLTDLANNAQISGTASWSGRLLGFTPSAEPVAGEAELAVALDTLAGALEFTELEHWTAGAAPGPAGTGTTWGDGDLGYVVAVRGNTFTRPTDIDFIREDGDDGIVTGAFFGTRHQAMGGTLQRDDLSAAFGGSR